MSIINRFFKSELLTSLFQGAAIAAPMFATLHAQGDYQGLQKLTATVAQWMFYPTLVCALLLILFGDRVLGLFGDEFVAARWSMTVLILNL